MNSCAEDAKTIRDEFKRLGFGTKDVSVRSSVYSMGSSIHVEIKSARLTYKVANDVATKYEHVRYCQASGEILSGGNRFIHVNRGKGCIAELVERHLAEVTRAADELANLPVNHLATIRPGIHLGWDGAPGRGFLVFGEHYNGRAWNAEDACVCLAHHLETIEQPTEAK